MKRLNKIEAKNHLHALELLKKPELSENEINFIFEHYCESATNLNGEAGAFFTPDALAWETTLELGDTPYEKPLKVIDLCAGIGILARNTLLRHPNAEVTCVEINPDYVEIGKRLVPQARWVCVNVTNISELQKLGRFDIAISNPPFGNVRTFRDTPKLQYSGSHAEYRVLEIASLIANYSIFIIPQESSGFRYSGVQCFEIYVSSKFQKFTDETGLILEPGSGIDTSCEGLNIWKGVSPRVEIVCVDNQEQAIPILKTGSLF